MSTSKVSVSRASEAYDLLRKDLMNGGLLPGTKLTISDLQNRYGLGAMPLREALNRLSAEQFVLKHDQRGFSVPPLLEEVFLEIQNARIVIESAALRETLDWYSREWEDRLVLAYHHLAKASVGTAESLLTEAWSQSHASFHQALISGCRNSWLLTFANQLYTQSARYRTRRRQIVSSSVPRRDNLLEEHRQIMEAAIDGSVDLAVERLVEHYRRSVETVLGAPVELCSGGLRFQRRPAHKAVE